ncbi:MAG: sigma 54-interacting transcriptional regulator [Verrucomicrobiota bacterium]
MVPKVDREYFRTVSQAAFCNPFSLDRQELYRRVIGRELPGDEILTAQLIREVLAQRFQRLEAKHGPLTLKAFPAEANETMRIVFLFDIYHQLFEPLDKLVTDQIAAGDTPCQIDFADHAIGLMSKRGFTSAESLRFFAIFFQIRRAHHFIHRRLVGESACMKEFRRRLWTNVFTHDIRNYERLLCERMEEFSTLLLGETGTGKGAAAMAIGRSGFIPFQRRKGCFAESFTRAFVSLNLSEFQETLIESELFGHRKGAFTGAVDSYDGVLAQCSQHGAVFLDEVGDVSIPIQIKLLQVLQERSFAPVGSREKRRFQGRVIAATNKSIEKLRNDGLFRNDFYYRLCSDSISVPPLRTRIAEDSNEMIRLVSHLVQRMTGEESPDLVASIHDAILAGTGASYRWPGNVRELEQAIRRVLLTNQYSGECPPTPDLSADLRNSLEEGNLKAGELLDGYCRLLYQRLGSYEAVARQTGLDRRTVKKHITNQEPDLP